MSSYIETHTIEMGHVIFVSPILLLSLIIWNKVLCKKIRILINADLVSFYNFCDFSTLERLFMLLLRVVYEHISQQIGHMLVHFEAKYYIDLIVSIELFGSVLTEVSWYMGRLEYISKSKRINKILLDFLAHFVSKNGLRSF